jgi:hypothetical protein
MGYTSHDSCKVCGERGRPVNIPGGTFYSYACTAEVVRMHDGTQRVIKPCPDIGRSGRDRIIGSRSDK